MDYDEYMLKFDSDAEEDDDPDIRQLKYNALFAEEDGFIIVLPGFKPNRYEIQPLPQPPKSRVYVHDSGLEQHDQIVSLMKEITCTMSGLSYSSSEISEILSAPQSPRHYPRKHDVPECPRRSSTQSQHSRRLSRSQRSMNRLQ